MEQIHSVCSLDGHVGRVWRVAWHPNGKVLASCGEDRSIRLWVHEDGERWVNAGIKTNAHARAVRSVSWSPCGKYLASAGFDGVVGIWSIVPGEAGGQEIENMASLEGHENEVKTAVWSPNGQLLATCGRDKSVWIWEVDDDLDCQCLSVLQPHSQDVKNVKWHPSGTQLFSCSYDNTVRIHEDELDDWCTKDTLLSHESTVWSLAFDKSGTRLVTVSADLTLRVWLCDNDTGKWRLISTVSGVHDQPIYDCDWCPMTNMIVSAGGDNQFCVYRLVPPDAANGRPDGGVELWGRERNGHEQDVNGVAWNPSPVRKGLLATCSDDESIRLWQVQDDDLSSEHIDVD